MDARRLAVSENYRKTSVEPRPIAKTVPVMPVARIKKDPTPVAVIRVPKFWPPSREVSVSAGPTGTVDISRLDGLDAFGSEHSGLPGNVSSPAGAFESKEGQPVGRINGGTHVGFLGAAIAVLIVGVVAVVSWQYQVRASASAPSTLLIETTPPGAEVFVSGEPAGRTPLSTSLTAGTYQLRVESSGQSRDFTVGLAAGATSSHRIEFPTVKATASVSTGSLQIPTDFKKATVSVDGVERGTAPVTIEGLTAGLHDVVVRSERGIVRRTVEIKPQQTVSLVMSGTEAPTIQAGWIAVSSPITMQLREGGRVIGTTESDRLMLPSGEHEIEIANDALGFSTVQRLVVSPGKTAATSIELPSGSLSINALPWAEVWVDGERIGETPIANLSRRIGTHQIVFKHPQYGERTESVIVTYQQPTRLGVDLRRP